MTTPMPPTDPSASDGKLPGEAELAALYRQLPQHEPGPALDAAVLRAAAQALEQGSGSPPARERRKAARESGDWVHPKPLSAIAARAIPAVDSAGGARRRAPHWLVGLASAASLVLVAGLAWHMRAAPGPSARSTPAGEDLEALQSAAGALPPGASAANPSGASMPAAAPPPPAAAMRQSAARANHLQAISVPGLKASAPGASATAAAPYALGKPTDGQADAAAIAATREAVLQKRAATAPRLPAVAEPTRLVAAPAPVAPVAAAASAPPAAGANAARADDTPAQELAKIRQLVQQHHQAEARVRLQAFQRTYPQWKLPADLRELLGEP